MTNDQIHIEGKKISNLLGEINDLIVNLRAANPGNARLQGTCVMLQTKLTPELAGFVVSEIENY